MLIAILLGFLAFAFLAYFLHLFFQLNKSERKLQEALTDVEASMLQQYGKPKVKIAAEEPAAKPKKKKA